jgi:hypothetical protein
MQIAILPRPEGLPDFKEALAALGRVPATLYNGLEHAAFRTSSFRDAECPGERLDGGLSASLFRFHGIRHLHKEGIEAVADEFRWTFDRLPFMGISFHYERLHVRVLKGPGGSLPGCGTSKKKNRFYGQIPTMYLIGTKPTRTKANLIVLWDFDEAYGLARLWLALPAVGGRRPQDVSAYWCESIPHPAEGLGTPPSPPPPPDDDLGGLIQREETTQQQRKTHR